MSEFVSNPPLETKEENVSSENAKVFTIVSVLTDTNSLDEVGYDSRGCEGGGSCSSGGGCGNCSSGCTGCSSCN